jgi:hypothetical protein
MDGEGKLFKYLGQKVNGGSNEKKILFLVQETLASGK